MLTNRHVLIGVDFSTAGMAAIREGCRLAGSCSGDATAIHVVEPPGDLALQEGFAPRPVDLRASMLDDARAKWRALAEALGPLPSVSFVPSVGSAASTLLEATEPIANALLVLGVNSSEPFRPGAGTVAAQCVRYARAPVLLVAPTFVGPYRHVLLATDFSSTAAVACRWADALAARDGARLTVLHVRSPRDYAPGAAQEGAAPPIEERVRVFVQDHAPLTAAAARVAVTPAEGRDRGKAIADYAAAEAVDLIVLGRRGHSPLRHLFVGSTAERLLKRVSCNVLLISPSAG